MAAQSTPSCSQKRASSATTAARCIAGAMRDSGTGDHSSRVALPSLARSALRRSMNEVVFGQPVARPETSGRVSQKTAAA